MTKAEAFGKLSKPDFKESDKILLLTHTDLDGSGPAVILRTLLDDVTVVHCDNGTMSSDIRNAVVDNSVSGNFDKIFVCDISCNPDDAHVINGVLKNSNQQLVLLDHHATAIHLNEFDWAYVGEGMIEDSFRNKLYPDSIPESERHSSATALMYDYLDYNNALGRYKMTLKDFTYKVSAYDTWDWQASMLNDKGCYDLNKIRNCYGMRIFEDEAVNKLRNGDINLIGESEKLMLRIENEKVQDHLKKVSKDIIVCDMDLDGKNYPAAICLSDKYLPDTFEYMKKTYPEVKIYAAICDHSISMRAKDPEVDLSEIAKSRGGGGHPGAAGITIPLEKSIAFVEGVMNVKITTSDPTPTSKHLPTKARTSPEVRANEAMATLSPVQTPTNDKTK